MIVPRKCGDQGHTCDSLNTSRVRQIAGCPDVSYELLSCFNHVGALPLSSVKRIALRQLYCTLTFSDPCVGLATLCEHLTPDHMCVRTLWFQCDRIIGVLQGSIEWFATQKDSSKCKHARCRPSIEIARVD